MENKKFSLRRSHRVIDSIKLNSLPAGFNGFEYFPNMSGELFDLIPCSFNALAFVGFCFEIILSLSSVWRQVSSYRIPETIVKPVVTKTYFNPLKADFLRQWH